MKEQVFPGRGCLAYGKAGKRVVMTENRNNNDLRTKYEFLIAGILVLVLCISAFAIYRVTGYLRSSSQAEPIIASGEASDGTVLIEVEITQETQESDGNAEGDLPPDGEEGLTEVLSEHDNILIFTTTSAGDNYYKSKEGRLTLYSEPADTEEPQPSLQEDVAFEVLGFNRDGWAAIEFGGARYYVKSANIIKTDAPEDALDKHKDPENTQGIRFFTPTEIDNIEYVVKMNTVAFNLPDVESSGNKIDLKAGERAIVVATSGNWFKIIYMNAEYYVLSYLEPREVWSDAHPDEEITDNTGYAPAGSPEAAASAAAAGGGEPLIPDNSGDGGTNETSANTDGNPSDTETTPTGGEDSSGSTDAGSDTVSGDSSYVKELLDMANAARAEAGLSPLKWSDTLASCAAARAAELPLLSNEQNKNHQRPNGQPWYTVNGYSESSSPMYAENIAYGQKSAQEVFDAWMDSEGHRSNIMNPDYKTFGAALFKTDSGYQYYWIEEFGY